MKKLLVLALVALVAGAAFADTDPVFSGSFSTYWAYSFAGESLSDDNSLGMTIDLGATIDDFNTVSVSVGLADAMYWDDVYDDDKIQSDTAAAAGTEPAANLSKDEIDNRGNYLRMNDFTLSTDLTGALGVDGPVSVMTKMGDFEFGTVNVANVAPLSTDVVGGSGADGGIGIAATIKILDMVELASVLYPVNAFDDSEKMRAETGVTMTAMGIADMIDVAAYFIASEYDYSVDPWNIDGDPVDDEGHNMGLSVAASVMDGLKIGLGFNYDLSATNTDGDKGVAAAQLDLAFTMVEKLALGLSYGLEDFTNDFGPASSIKFSATYALMDTLSVYAGIGMNLDFDNFEGKDLDYDFGITTSLKALAIQVGVSNNMDFKAPEDDWDDALFVKFSTSF